MQALVNLLSNAVKYNRKNGSITLRCETLDDGMLRLFVIDTGIGIASERHQDIYTPFERLGNEPKSATIPSTTSVNAPPTAIG